MMPRWLIQLSGERMDLEEFPRWFPTGAIHAIEEDGAFFLVGSAFDALPNAKAVLDEASRALDEFAAVISLLWPSLNKPVPSHVFRETDDGRRNAFVLLAGAGRIRTKMHAATLSVGNAPKAAQLTQAQDLLKRARSSQHLEAALSLWADPWRSWPRLYRVLEEVEQYLGKTVDAAGFASAGQRELFRRTANTAEVAGPDARHAVGKYTPPARPMTLHDATDFVGGILLRALK